MNFPQRAVAHLKLIYTPPVAGAIRKSLDPEAEALEAGEKYFTSDLQVPLNFINKA